MAFSSTTVRVPYVGDGTTTSFGFPYEFINPADLIVVLSDYSNPLAPTFSTKTLNSDYSLSGTLTNGAYLSGANVVMVTAPTSTQFLVIIRGPSPVQNFNIAENGIIPSVSLCQQLDYITTLIQRLTDLTSRAVTLQDGDTETFSTLLPAALSQSAGAALIINAQGNGLAIGPTTSAALAASIDIWNKVSLPYTAFQTASTTSTVTAATLPALYMLNGLVIKHSIAFSGGSISDVTMGIGISTDHGKFINSFDVLQSVSDTAFDYIFDPFIGSFANPTSIQLTATSTSANLSSLSAGSVDVYYRYAPL